MAGPRILVTLGDPRGIGPEVAVEASRVVAEAGDPAPTFVVPDGVLGDPSSIAELAEAARARDDDVDAGRFAARSIERAVEIALRGDAHAIVTAPLHKPSLHAAGRAFPGQTEMLGALTGVERVGMLMAAERTKLGGPLRVLLATTHLALRDVPSALTEDLVVGQLELLHSALCRDWGMSAPRIAMCALNPHASDGGLFGDEEQCVLGPALERARASGVVVDGPLPADTVFVRALGGDFDAVAAPYHDVGMAAFKTASFGSGVNVTLGLPFVRTSPDHGTAFDLAGKGLADAGSMVEALRLARTLANERFDMDSADV